MLFQTRTGVRLGVALSLSLALSAAACGGKSNRNEANGTGGDAPEAGAGAQVSSSGVASSSGGTPSGGAIATSGGAIATSGGAIATSGGAIATSGGAIATSGGAKNGEAASGGAGVACVAPNGSVQYEFRSCLIDSDCATLIQPTCCGGSRVLGIAKYLMCSVQTPTCAAADCHTFSGFQTDDGLRTEDLAEVSLICQFGEPGAGLCDTTLVGSGIDAPLACGSGTCDRGELCVHRSARGGTAPRCFPIPADGLCPADTEYREDCNGQPGCIELLLEPEPQCAPIPPGCGSPTACACLPRELCGAPQVCRGAVGRQVYCQDESL